MVEMSRGPFRGIYAEIAREKGISRQAIQKGVRQKRPEILQLVAKKIRERARKIEHYTRTIEAIRISTINKRTTKREPSKWFPFLLMRTIRKVVASSP
jgi:predicted transcriptional regulator